MAILPSKNKHILRIVLLSIAAIPVLLILYIVVASLLSPVFDGIDKARFEELDTQSRALYERIKTASGGSEIWTYTASCEDAGSGGFQTYPQYNCQTLIAMVANVTSVTQLNALHDKYYPVIDSASMLRRKTELDKEYPGDFGLKFVRSSAEKKYTTSEGNIDCTYSADLSDRENDIYGATLSTDRAIVTISLSCSGKARDNWYSS